MDFIINHAILHVLNGNEERFSNEELDLDSDVCCGFITRHLRKIMGDASAKEAVFSAESEVYGLTNAYMESSLSFREYSVKVCEKFSSIMKENQMPPADILVVQFDLKDDGYLAVIKLNYKECFTHSQNSKETGNHLINVPSLDSGKIDGACVIPYNPMVLRIIEKPFDINGQPTPYFSETFLQCQAEMSKKEMALIISDITDEINSRYFNGSLEIESKIKAALIEESLEEDGAISIESVAKKAFPDVEGSENEEIRGEFIKLSKDAGLVGDANLGEKYAKQQFAQVKFKAEGGIELKFPTAVFDDPSVIEFHDNSDGSVTITLKNLYRA